MPRQTADLVALILAITVAVVVLGTAFVLLWNELTVPDYDSIEAVDAIGRIIGVLIGALVGFMAGRKINGANGH